MNYPISCENLSANSNHVIFAKTQNNKFSHRDRYNPYDPFQTHSEYGRITPSFPRYISRILKSSPVPTASIFFKSSVLQRTLIFIIPHHIVSYRIASIKHWAINICHILHDRCRILQTDTFVTIKYWLIVICHVLGANTAKSIISDARNEINDLRHREFGTVAVVLVAANQLEEEYWQRTRPRGDDARTHELLCCETATNTKCTEQRLYTHHYTVSTKKL